MRDFLTTLLELIRVVNRSRKIAPIRDDDVVNLASLIDRQIAAQPDAPMVVDATGATTWREFGNLANRISNALLEHGVGEGDAVALNMENDVLYLACVVGICRIGSIAGLINTGLRGKQLIHCVKEVDAVLTIVGANGLAALHESEQEFRAEMGEGHPIWAFADSLGERDRQCTIVDGQTILDKASDRRPAPGAGVTAGSPALYIFTSGTTGMPKAAIITHRKFMEGAAQAAIQFFRATPKDRLYLCLPLYHGSGLSIGAAACFHSGASLFLRKKFSASHCIDEINRYGCNLFIYVGDICRYLMDTSPRPDDQSCKLKTAVGNGLRPDIFKAFRRRFGIGRICEFYAASEGNGGFVNLLNKDETIGMTGGTLKLVDYSRDDADVRRGENGRLMEVPEGEAGLLLFEVNETAPFSGYKNREASKKKLVRNAFVDGDCWFNTGDLVRRVDVGPSFGIPHYQFVDRLGDTFRWKSENVSTMELSEILCGFDQIHLAAVYGVAVPGNDGKAGMAALQLANGQTALDLPRLSRYVCENLPGYARPRFIRLKDSLDITGTHKIVKGRLVEEGYDLGKVADPVFYMNTTNWQYEPLTSDVSERINTAAISL